MTTASFRGRTRRRRWERGYVHFADQEVHVSDLNSGPPALARGLARCLIARGERDVFGRTSTVMSVVATAQIAVRGGSRTTPARRMGGSRRREARSSRIRAEPSSLRPRTCLATTACNPTWRMTRGGRITTPMEWRHVRCRRIARQPVAAARHGPSRCNRRASAGVRWNAGGVDEIRRSEVPHPEGAGAVVTLVFAR